MLSWHGKILWRPWTYKLSTICPWNADSSEPGLSLRDSAEIQTLFYGFWFLDGSLCVIFPLVHVKDIFFSGYEPFRKDHWELCKNISQHPTLSTAIYLTLVSDIDCRLEVPFFIGAFVTALRVLSCLTSVFYCKQTSNQGNKKYLGF